MCAVFTGITYASSLLELFLLILVNPCRPKDTMINFIKKISQRSIVRIVNYLGAKKVGRVIFRQILSVTTHATKQISHRQVELTFSIPNQVCEHRVSTFSTKEPETLAWIDTMPIGSIMWDVGANVGLYSCYAAKARGCQVFSFEPSVMNVELLARNIYLNELTDQVVVMPWPLSNKLELNTLNMTSTERGGALSTFGKNYGWDGQDLKRVFQFRTLGISADEALALFQLPTPSYLKIDVDGIEHLILSGSQNILKTVEGVLIEINDDFHEQAAQCQQLLKEAGLILEVKLRSEMFENPNDFFGGKVWNQIWRRPSGDTARGDIN